MSDNGWDAVVITGSDPHSSEYPAPRWKQVEWLTGFTGEAGDVVVTADHAGLWTEGKLIEKVMVRVNDNISSFMCGVRLGNVHSSNL